MKLPGAYRYAKRGVGGISPEGFEEQEADGPYLILPSDPTTKMVVYKALLQGMNSPVQSQNGSGAYRW